MIKSNIFNLQGVELFVIDDFLTPIECDHFCELIQTENVPSEVVSRGDQKSRTDSGRTSQSAFIDSDEHVVRTVDKRICELLDISMDYGEPMQGQLYNQGEFYNDHHDYFDEESLKKHHVDSGQRTWTAMIYVNDVVSGGYTEFPLLGKAIAPKKGKAVFWKNSDGRGTENPNTLHSGRPVIEGHKMIITKWFRERPLNDNTSKNRQTIPIDENESIYSIAAINGRKHKVKVEYINGIPHARYPRNTDIPQLTSTGFKKLDIPAKLYERIMTFYKEGLKTSIPEFDPNDSDDDLNNFISSDSSHYPTKMIPLNDEMKNLIFREVQIELERWSKRKLAATYCYGIRTYNRGAILKKHTDGFETRIISAILNIDQKIDAPWALQIDDHDGVEHEVYLEPGQMVFYESAILSHGRVKPFEGDYYSNLFVHYVNLS